MLTGMAAARLAAMRSIRPSPPEQGRCPASRAVMAAIQSMLAIGVDASVMLMPVCMKSSLKSPRCSQVAWLMISSQAASSG